MRHLSEIVIAYHQAFHRFRTTGEMPDDGFFQMEDDILDQLGFQSGERHLYQWALQLRMASLKDAPESKVVEDISRFMSDFYGKDKGLVFFRGFDISEVAFCKDSMFSVSIKYLYSEWDDGKEECVYKKRECLLILEDIQGLTKLFEPTGSVGVYILGLISERLLTCNADITVVLNMRKECGADISLADCLLRTEWENGPESDENALDTYEVQECYPSFKLLEMAMNEMGATFPEYNSSGFHIRQISSFVYSVKDFELTEEEFASIFTGFYEAWCIHESQKMDWLDFISAVHHYLARTNNFINIETINKTVEQIICSLKEKQSDLSG